MTRWADDPPRKHPPDPPDPNAVTDDPLAALGLTASMRKGGRNKEQVYAVSRVNPLFHIFPKEPNHIPVEPKSTGFPTRSRSPPVPGCTNSNSSDYIRSPTRQKFRGQRSRSRFSHADNEEFHEFGRSRRTSSEYTRSPTREKTPEIDYNDPLEQNGYIRSSFRKQSTESGSIRESLRQKSHSLREQSNSSGYGGSNETSSLDNVFNDHLRLVEETGANLDQNPAFVKSIRIAGRGLKTTKSVPSQHSSSSAGGTLTTIPEGKVDLPVPQPIWPGPLDRNLLNGYTYDSLVDEALLLYTSLSNQNQFSDNQNKLDNYFDISVKDLLLDLLASINQTLEGKTGSPEEMLKVINEKIKLKLEALKNNTEEEMKKLCVNLSNNRKMNSVIRAFSHSSSSGQSSSSGRVRTSISNDDDIYHIPSGSSSSGFSDSPPGQRRTATPLLPNLYGRKPSILSQLYCDHDTSTLSRGIRNALIYGTLCRHKMTSPNQKRTLGLPTMCQKLFDKENNQSLATPCATIDQCKNGVQTNQIVKHNISCARNKLNCLNKFNCDKNNILVKGGSVPKGSSLGYRDERPSVWQLYYGMQAEGSQRQGEGSPKDVPVFPGGRPEADFTLDVPRSELLSKRLRDDKKWRFRCRVLTSFLGLVFFLLSVMAVSLLLTRGKRMFGSMV